MKFRLRSAHRGLTGCGLRHGPIGRLPCRAVPGRARRLGAPAARVADARPRFGALGNGRSAHRPEWPEDVRAPAGRRAVARCSGDAGSSAGFQPESASNSLEFAGNPPRTPRQRRLPAMRAPFERRSVRGDSVVRLGIRARPFEPPTHRPASDDPARSPPSQARSGVPAAPARPAESTRDLTVRCPFGTRALPRLPRSPAAGAVRETCLIIRHSRYSWIPRNSPFQLIERFSS